MAEKEEKNTIWVISNRKDDRTVLFERDALHPGGEAFIGGSGPEHVARTARIEELLRSGEIIEIPEPPEKIGEEPNRKKPVPTQAVEGGPAPAQPGQPIPLGRELDPDIVPLSAQKKVQAAQAEAPSHIKSRAEVPPPAKGEKESSRS